MNADGHPEPPARTPSIINAPEDDFALLYRAAAGPAPVDRSLDSWDALRPSLAPTGEDLFSQ